MKPGLSVMMAWPPFEDAREALVVVDAPRHSERSRGISPHQHAGPHYSVVLSEREGSPVATVESKTVSVFFDRFVAFRQRALEECSSSWAANAR
jgi:hypothetical protein